jgi:uncharacterized protein YdbL (DUF1318 family)
MNNKKRLTISILVVLGLLALMGTAAADGIKDRMKQRLPAIVELKAKGIVGENNSGYLAFVTGQTRQEEIVESENKDRKAIYTQIAKQQNTSLELVEKRRAITLAERAISGEFIQDAHGTWIQK